ncbi:MAG: thiamine phosphate synthase [Crocinitomicaceae bacterium]|nr:thiamine phosphate synthase [Crocinitomicaceae bacterium]
MIIVLSSENDHIQEIKWIKELFSIESSFLFHVRKPHWTMDRQKEFLLHFSKKELKRISIHQHYELKKDFPALKLHQKDIESTTALSFNSRSFHSLENAKEKGKEYDYFFCSPIFKSLSKTNYSPTENWDISQQSKDFQSKAVALGGLDENSLHLAKNMGFTNFAFLGAIWNFENPVERLKTLLQHV